MFGPILSFIIVTLLGEKFLGKEFENINASTRFVLLNLKFLSNHLPEHNRIKILILPLVE